MSTAFTAACIQMCAGTETAANLESAALAVRDAADSGALLVCLPEYFAGLDVLGGILVSEPFEEDAHPALPLFIGLAEELSIHLLLGSLAIRIPSGGISNRSYVIGPTGAIAARYDKIHLFDVDLEGGESYRESATIVPGNHAVLVDLPWGRLGMSVCYDVRFARLYRKLAQAGAEFLAIPSAFTRTTGRDHWHVLVRARAIETGSYVIAPSQCGVHAGGAASYGHSLIVDPWGKVLADGGEEPGIILAEIVPSQVAEVRARVPALVHDREFEAP